MADDEAVPTSDPSLSEATQLKQVAADRTVDSQSSLECDGPVQSPAFLQDTSSAAPSSLADRSFPSMQSQPAPSSLCADRGEESSVVGAGAITPHSPQGGAGSEIFVVHYKGFLLPDVEEPSVFVVDYVPAMDVLENASQTGTFAGTVCSLCLCLYIYLFPQL